MANTNTFLTPTIIAKEALMLLKNNLVMGSNVYRDYEAEFPGDPKKGGTVTIRKPVKFSVTKARTRTNSNVTENSITLSVATQAHVSWAFYTKDLALSIEEYSTRYIRPAAAAIANQIDNDLCGLYTDVYNAVYESTGFVTPNTFMVMGKAMQRLDEEASPPEDRVVVFNPAAHWSMANALTALYQQEPGTKAIRKGYLGTIANAKIFMDQNIKTHTVGNYSNSGSTGTDRIKVATTGPAAGSTTINLIDLKNVSTVAFKDGDVFTVASVYAVNPMSGESTGVLRQFVITADASCAATETTSAAMVTVYVSPEITETGAYKTVNTLPAAAATVTMLGNEGSLYPQNLAFHKNAFALVMVPLPKPADTWGSTVSDEGFSIRIVKDYDISADEEICRMDVLYGVKTVYPELAVRIWGQQTT